MKERQKEGNGNEKTDSIDHSAGIILHKRIGDFVEKGEVIATMYADDDEKFVVAEDVFINSVTIKEVEPIKEPLIFEVIS